MLDWMIRAAIVGGIATTAAWLFEHGLRNAKMGTRHAWTFALLATTLLPVIPRLTPGLPVSAVVPEITSDIGCIKRPRKTNAPPRVLAQSIIRISPGRPSLPSKISRSRLVWRSTINRLDSFFIQSLLSNSTLLVT